jgi:hypothetical protein
MSELNLSDIPGLGPVRRQALAEAGVQDLPGLLAMKVAELAAIRGVGLWQARKIREYLRQRGMVLMDDEDGTGVVVQNARSVADVQAVADAVIAMEQQAAHEAEVEEEVELLVAAMEARSQDGATAPEADTTAVDEDADETDEASEDEEAGDEEAQDEGSADQEKAEEIRAQRERLPEAALALMEAIRQASVTRQLTRQITRFLITAGEFGTDEKPLKGGQQKKVSAAIGQVEGALQRAIQKRAFRPVEQRDLADRIRRRRKDLEKLLDTD